MTARALPLKPLPTRTEILATFNRSYQQVNTKTASFWDSTFRVQGIEENPFAMAIYIIRYFSPPSMKTEEGLFSLTKMLDEDKSNVLSGCIALTALMQARQWDVECFYNSEECYIGFNLSENWQVRKGSWVEMDGKRYYLKEFDDSTAIGETRVDRAGTRYSSLKAKRRDLKPIPVVDRLPVFSDRPSESHRFKWNHDYVAHELTIAIPRAQLNWTKNLPPCISGAVHAGLEELRRIGLDRQLRNLVSGESEYEQVDLLLKFCQSETNFKYTTGLPIRSVTRQIWDGANDCDGRSVFLCCLLCTVLDYPLENIVFVSWENHLALGVQPRSAECLDTLKLGGNYVGDNFFILDAAYMGATHWGSKMKNLSEKYEIIHPSVSKFTSNQRSF
jgi:hypothetical protein